MVEQSNDFRESLLNDHLTQPDCPSPHVNRDNSYREEKKDNESDHQNHHHHNHHQPHASTHDDSQCACSPTGCVARCLCGCTFSLIVYLVFGKIINFHHR